MIYKNNFQSCKELLGENITSSQFGEILDKIAETRNRVDHPYEVHVDTLEVTIFRIRTICHNTSLAKDMLNYLERSLYEQGCEAPPPKCISNLIKPSYECDGGFISRPETKIIMDMINRKLNRIINIIGSGGVGKTAIAEYICNHYYNDSGNPFYAILFYTAKEKMLTPKGIIDVDSNLSDYETFIDDIHHSLLPSSPLLKKTTETKQAEIYDFVDESKGNHRCLLVIDNLENPDLFRNRRLRSFITDFPRDSQIIITSRVGTDMPEEKQKIVQMNDKQAIELLKRYTLSRFRNRTTLYELSDVELISLVDKVFRIPLLIKMAVGRHIELGQHLNLAFSVSGNKDKDAINFMLADTFALLSPNAKLFLECMAKHKSNTMSRAALIEMTGIFDVSEFEAMVLQVEAVSLVKREILKSEELFVIDQIANKYVQDLTYNNHSKNDIIAEKYRRLLARIDTARQYLDSISIEGIDSELKESEYLAASHVSDAINYNKTRNYNPSKAYELASNEFKIAIELAPWWHHSYMEYAFFEANWNHPDLASNLLKDAKEKNPKSENYAKYQNVVKLITPLASYKAIEHIKLGQIIDLTITGIGSKGDGIANYGDGGYYIIIKNSNLHHGEMVKARINAVKKDFAFAELVDI